MRRSLLTVLAVLVVIAGACGGDGDKKVTAAGDDTTTTVEETTTTTTEAVTTTAPKPTTTAKPVNTKEKKCVTAETQGVQPRPDNWAATWQTEPDANQPLTLEICIDDVTPSPTQQVTLTVTADDPDASIGTGQCDIHVTWDSAPGSLCRDALIAPQGPEPTPAKEHGHVEQTYLHVYEDKGDRTIEVTVWSSKFNGKPHPYDNYASAQLKVSVK